MQSTQKAVEGATALFVRLSVCSVVVDDKRERQNIARAYGTGVGARRGVGINFLLQSCCCKCYVIQPVHHVLHECVVGYPNLSSMYEHVPINHRGVGIDSFIEIMLLLVLRHPTCASCVA